ncbi:uncharacterized protein LOC105381660 [Plutella xylostella]|uniref:uncharacterized protein LOC105381660 n=1 Tax=Plutella xylostella TaxID=51655 RepID=UPI002033062B|nr:uncharacterized protein LOC105381660 [Plutella xylostella]
MFSEEEIKVIAQKHGDFHVIDWKVVKINEPLIGYLAEHLKLIITVESNRNVSELNCFVKCVPRFDRDKAQYIVENGFFKKEYTMLNTLFKEVGGEEGPRQWRPKVLYIKPELFVFEDVTELGYTMPYYEHCLSEAEIFAAVEAVARFHAQSYIYEERKSQILKRPYRLWEDFSEYFQEPSQMAWRHTGMKAVIDVLIIYSKHKNAPGFAKRLYETIYKLCNEAVELTKPSSTVRNAVVHRDLWTNNIFLKSDERGTRALLIDYQTVLYCSPMLDISSLLYFNTTRSFRERFLDNILNFYYDMLSQELRQANIDVDTVFDKAALLKDYTKSILFGIIQAALIVPVGSMNMKDKLKIFDNPDTFYQINEVSRSEEIIEVASREHLYRERVLEIFDELVERFVLI